MRYSYEFKLKAIDMYRQGQWIEPPDEKAKPKGYHDMIRRWSEMEKENGPEVLKHRNSNKIWSPEEKLTLISRVLSGQSNKTVAIQAGINAGLLYQWVQKYKTQGYNGLVNNKKGRPSKGNVMRKETNPRPLTESEREELIRLRAENAYIKAENEVIKKRIALRQGKWAAQLKAKKQQSSKNSEKKGIN